MFVIKMHLAPGKFIEVRLLSFFSAALKYGHRRLFYFTLIFVVLNV